MPAVPRTPPVARYLREQSSVIEHGPVADAGRYQGYQGHNEMLTTPARTPGPDGPRATGEAAANAGASAGDAWGVRLLRRLPPRPRAALALLATLWRRVEVLAPLCVVALMLVLMARAYYVRWGFAYMKWGADQTKVGVPKLLAFNDLGSRWAVLIGDGAEAVPITGYDGQAYYYLAQHPKLVLSCAKSRVNCPLDEPLLREQRILYPATARLVALNDPARLHATLFLIDFAAILLTALLVGMLCVASGASRWLGAAAGLFCGELLGLLRDLTDPYAVLWAVLAVYLLRKRRPLWSALAVAAALLTREQLVLVLPLLALPLLAGRRWRMLAAWLVMALGPFAVWQLVLRILYGKWPVSFSSSTASVVPLPFAGLWQYRYGPEFGVTVAFVAVPLVLAVLIALAAIWQSGPRDLLRDPLPLIVLLYCLLATLMPYAEWQGMWSSARLAAPGIILAVIVACRVRPSLRGAYALLLALTVLAPLMMAPVLY